MRFSGTPLKKMISRIGRRKIMVLMGGDSAEREISLLSGRAVLNALQSYKLNVHGADIKSWRDLPKLVRLGTEVAFLCLHGPGGEDGSVQGVLEWMRIPYTGSGVLASALAMNKSRAKQIFQSAGLLTAEWECHSGVSLPGEASKRVPGRGSIKLKLPLVVKPNQQGSAMGVSIIKRWRDFPAAWQQARIYGREVILEKYCRGTELSVGVLSQQVLPVIEIVPKNDFYDYEAKYVTGMSEHIIPARIKPGQSARARQMALSAHRILGCRGATRVDMILGARGEINIMEVNTSPGMTATSLLPEAARYAGISFGSLLMGLILEALEEKL